jgi:hypothetical protein
MIHRLAHFGMSTESTKRKAGQLKCEGFNRKRLRVDRLHTLLFFTAFYKGPTSMLKPLWALTLVIIIE